MTNFSFLLLGALVIFKKIVHLSTGMEGPVEGGRCQDYGS